MIEKLDVSPYLLAPPRSLRQACIDVTGCHGGSRDLCRMCSLAELCIPGDAATHQAEPPHRLQRLAIRVIPGGESRARGSRDLVRLRGV